MIIYLDESGDLGWKFDSPYRQGGSSRYLTIACLLIPPHLKHLPKRIVKKTYTRKKWPHNKELKSTNLSKDDKLQFVDKVVTLLQKQPEIKISSITVYKPNVQQHIREDANKLYNYMINLLLVDQIRLFPVVTFIPDPRTIKVKSQNSLVDYLQIKLWFEHNAQTIIYNQPLESKHSLNLQFVDFIARIIWDKYEDNESDPFNKLKPFLNKKELFFT